MNTILLYLMTPTSAAIVDIMLCFFRVSIGILMARFGYEKLTEGPSTWRYIGAAMGNLGIHFLPAVWGFLGACVELFGGIAFILGLGTRIAAIFLIFMMGMALLWLLRNYEAYRVYSYPLALMLVFITFLVIGSGPWSLDSYLVLNG